MLVPLFYFLVLVFFALPATTDTRTRASVLVRALCIAVLAEICIAVIFVVRLVFRRGLGLLGGGR